MKYNSQSVNTVIYCTISFSLLVLVWQYTTVQNEYDILQINVVQLNVKLHVLYGMNLKIQH